MSIDIKVLNIDQNYREEKEGKMMKCIIATEQKHFYDQVLVRKEVFIIEQNVPIEEEFDQHDREAVQFVVYDGDQAVGAGRFRIVDNKGKIERICVLKSHRKRGIGRLLIETIETYARTNTDIDTLILGAQLQAMPFYERLGFQADGDIFLDANIEHRWMKKDIKKLISS